MAANWCRVAVVATSPHLLNGRLHSDDDFRVSISYTKSAFSPGSYYAVAGSASGTVLVWDAHSGEVERRLKGHRAAVPCVAWSGDGLRIASGDKSGVLRLWK